MLLVVACVGMTVPVWAETVTADRDGELCRLDLVNRVDPPGIEYAPVAFVMDYETGTVLHEHNADVARVPASLTKLVTIYTALEASRGGEFSLDEPLPVDPRAYASEIAPGSSLMFLGPEQFVSGRDLLRGLAVSSGNDAAVEVALRVSRSVSSFVARMNGVVRALGFSSMYFEDTAGLSPGNRITAREMAEFTRILIEQWPETLDSLFALPHFAYPQSHHYVGEVLQGGTILQYNRNTLIETYPGADGLKTGYTSAAGYNLVATATRDDRRLIVVILGIDAPNHTVGSERRSQDAEQLLDWGFENFRTIRPSVPDLEDAVVWGGQVRTVALRADNPLPIVLPEELVGGLRGEIHVPSEFWAPREVHEATGSLRYYLGDCLVQEVPVWPADTVEEGTLFRRLWDRLRWWLRDFFGQG